MPTILSLLPLARGAAVVATGGGRHESSQTRKDTNVRIKHVVTSTVMRLCSCGRVVHRVICVCAASAVSALCNDIMLAAQRISEEVILEYK